MYNWYLNILNKEEDVTDNWIVVFYKAKNPEGYSGF